MSYYHITHPINFKQIPVNSNRGTQIINKYYHKYINNNMYGGESAFHTPQKKNPFHLYENPTNDDDDEYLSDDSLSDISPSHKLQQKELILNILDIKVPYMKKNILDILHKNKYNLSYTIEAYISNIDLLLEPEYIYNTLKELKNIHNHPDYISLIKLLILNNFELDKLIDYLPIIPDTPSKIGNVIPEHLVLSESKKNILKTKSLTSLDDTIHFKSKLDKYRNSPEFNLIPNNLRKKVLNSIDYLRTLISIFIKPDEISNEYYSRYRVTHFKNYYPDLNSDRKKLKDTYPTIYNHIFT